MASVLPSICTLQELHVVVMNTLNEISGSANVETTLGAYNYSSDMSACCFFPCWYDSADQITSTETISGYLELVSQ